MLSIRTVSAAQAVTYYYKQDCLQVDDPRDPSSWWGKGAEELGLSGAVYKDQFENLLHGRSPGGEQLIPVGQKLNEKTQQFEDHHRAGTDLTFNAPKSVSILAMVCGDTWLLEAVERASEKAMDYIEREAVQARISQGGEKIRVDTGNLVAAKYNHNVTRSPDKTSLPDPHAHVHYVMMNATKTGDGKWRANEPKEIFSAKLAGDAVFMSDLARQVMEMGYGIDWDYRTGTFEIKGVSQELLNQFSKRSEAIKERAEELREKYPNASDTQLRQMATLETRLSKESHKPEELEKSWQEQLCEKGYTPQIILEEAKEAGKDISKDVSIEFAKEKVDQVIRGLTENSATFTTHELNKEVIRAGGGRLDYEKVQQAVADLKNQGELLQHNKILTTREMIEKEREILAVAERGRGAITQAMTKEEAQKSIDTWEETAGKKLNADQRAAVEHIATARDTVIGIQGDSGSGKTALLNAARETLEKQGYKVSGTAYTGKAGDELEGGADIKSATLDKFLAERAAVRAVGEKQAWVVDECSMVGTRQMHDLLIKAEKAGARVVLCGDTKQLSAINAGKPFAQLQKHGMATAHVKENIRQQDPGYKAIAIALAKGETDKALDMMIERGMIVEIADKTERLNTLADEYTAIPGAKTTTAVVTARNTDKDTINNRIRATLKERGEIAKEGRSFQTLDPKGLSGVQKNYAFNYGTGEVIQSKKAGIMGRAGSEGKVTAVDREKNSITVEVKGEKGTKSHIIDLSKNGQDLSTYRENVAEICKGESIIFSKNNAGLGVKNGQVGSVKEIKGDILSIEVGKGEKAKTVEVDTKSYRNVSHGYAVTIMKSQGISSGDVRGNFDTSQGGSFNEFYVGVTRGVKNAKFYTNSISELRDVIKTPEVKTSALDIAQAREAAREEQQRHTPHGPSLDEANTKLRQFFTFNTPQRSTGRGDDMARSKFGQSQGQSAPSRSDSGRSAGGRGGGPER